MGQRGRRSVGLRVLWDQIEREHRSVRVDSLPALQRVKRRGGLMALAVLKSEQRSSGSSVAKTITKTRRNNGYAGKLTRDCSTEDTRSRFLLTFTSVRCFFLSLAP